MLTARIIPCLDVKDGRIVKGVRFSNLRDAGDPAERAALYEATGADEIVVLDISATLESRKTRTATVQSVRARLSIPLTVGGGVRTIADAGDLLDAGADKVAINSAAVEDPTRISLIAERFGAQCCVLALDAAKTEAGTYQVVVKSGRERTQLDAVLWAKQAVDRGAGEILLTSFDKDGTRSGYDLPLIQAVSNAVRVPIIASGGAAGADHLVEALSHGADAVLAASIFHDGELTPNDVKHALRARGIEVRL
ncbi:MAG: imidazole glycerol phosphate synthase subunit HisF [Polyangiaceae bacterium]|nr:imidazole glycerol phosphate synthase subunit HisF [Polyangiaceae bacterium]